VRNKHYTCCELIIAVETIFSTNESNKMLTLCVVDILKAISLVSDAMFQPSYFDAFHILALWIDNPFISNWTCRMSRWFVIFIQVRLFSSLITMSVSSLKSSSVHREWMVNSSCSRFYSIIINKMASIYKKLNKMLLFIFPVGLWTVNGW
jgi:hypothetical protein